MGWSEWMVVQRTVEQDLEIEKAARIPLHHDDAQAVRELCSKLVRHSMMQDMLVKQALGRIIELEAMLMASDRQKPARRPWWRLW